MSSGTATVTASEARLVSLIAEAERGPRRDGLYALWLVLRAAESVLPPHPVSLKNHRRRLQALEARLGGLALPAPLKRALASARAHLDPGTPAAAAIALSQLITPTREVLGSEAGEAIAAAVRDARLH
jgi:hypothetical protein